MLTVQKPHKRCETEERRTLCVSQTLTGLHLPGHSKPRLKCSSHACALAQRVVFPIGHKRNVCHC